MSSKAIFRLQGVHFYREFALQDHTIDKSSISVFRSPFGICNNLDPYGVLTEYPVLNVKDFKISSFTKLSKKISKLVGENVSILVLDFDKQIYVNSNDIYEEKLRVEEYISSRHWKNFSRRNGISTDKLIDSLLYRPIIQTDQDISINDQIIQKLSAVKIGESKTTIITGEMVWSNWLSFEGISNFFKNSSQDDVFVIDTLGILYEYSRRKEDISFDTIRINTIGITVDRSSKSTILDEEGKVTFKEGDYFTKYKFNPKVTKPSDFYIQLGMEINKYVPLTKLILKKEKIEIKFYKDVNFKVKKGDLLNRDTDFANLPVYNDSKLSFKFPRQYEYLVEDGEMVSKDQIIAKKYLARGFIKESVKSPVKGRVDLKYKNLGRINIHSFDKSDIALRPDFEGVVEDIIHHKNFTNFIVETNTIEIPYAFSFGDDFFGTLVKYKDLSEDNKPKILLIDEKDLKNLDKEKIANCCIAGLILLNCSYLGIEKLKNTFVGIEEYLPTILLNGFNKELSVEVDNFLFSMCGHFVKKQNNKLFILLDRNEVRPIYAKIKSREKIQSTHDLKKGEFVSILNYFDSNSYARIEKVGRKNVFLSSGKEIFQSDITNLIKYQIITSEKSEQ